MADPKATPISALPRGPQGQGDDDQQFIQNILQQMNNDNQESEQAYQQTQQNYNQQQFAVNPGEQHARNQKQIQETAQYEQMEDDGYEQYQYEEEVPMTFIDKLKMEIKAPIVFVILYFILSIPFIRYFIADQLKRFTENKNILIYSSALICGLVGGVIFYFINKFVIKF